MHDQKIFNCEFCDKPTIYDVIFIIMIQLHFIMFDIRAAKNSIQHYLFSALDIGISKMFLQEFHDHLASK